VMMKIFHLHSVGESTFILVSFQKYSHSFSMGIELTLLIYTVVRIPKDARTVQTIRTRPQIVSGDFYPNKQPLKAFPVKGPFAAC
jgi:hypothetical protein